MSKGTFVQQNVKIISENVKNVGWGKKKKVFIFTLFLGEAI